MRLWLTALALALFFAAAACTDGRSASPSSAVTQPNPASSVNAVAGTWIGSAADNQGSGTSGTVMGMSMQPGMGGGMMGGNGMMGSGGNMTWIITQTGNTFTGTVAFAGVQCAAQMTMSGTFSGNGGTFTISMPANSMPMAGCSGSATGTFTIDPVTGEMRGTYSGTSSCMGAFSGQLTLVRK